MAYSSSGLGHLPLKEEIRGSNPLCATHKSRSCGTFRSLVQLICNQTSDLFLGSDHHIKRGHFMLSRTARTELYSKYDKASQLPLLVLALLMIPLLLLPELVELSPEQSNLIDASDWFIYACFAADFAIKIYLAPSAMGHIKRNWLDVLILLLPLLRPLRILQGARMLRLVRALRLLSFAGEGFKKLQGILARRRLNLVLLITLMVVVLCAGLVYAFEKSEGGTITSFGDALWWALATVTTVGYGDVVPHTAEGRGVALFLMLAGITFLVFLLLMLQLISLSRTKTTRVLRWKVSSTLFLSVCVS
jgi:voltage-gated potassium channel